MGASGTKYSNTHQMKSTLFSYKEEKMIDVCEVGAEKLKSAIFITGFTDYTTSPKLSHNRKEGSNTPKILIQTILSNAFSSPNRCAEFFSKILSNRSKSI